jgi:uncharacterized FlaG/YvyC family protein
MDIDRTQAAEQQTTDHRARTHGAADRAPAPPDAAPVSRPEHGGALAASRGENPADRQATAETAAQERRKSALAALARQIHLPTDSELDIEVDVAREEVTFLVRDRDTGEIVRRIPPDESRSLIDLLRDHHGFLVDRSL